MDLEKYENDITAYCLDAFNENKITNAVQLADELMSIEGFIMHNPAHHYLVPAALLTVYNKLSNNPASMLETQLEEAKKRAHEIKGGVCGTHGNCGAAVGTGIFFSVAEGTTPKSGVTWGHANFATGKALVEMGAYGGPRCCKRCSFVALLQASELAQNIFNLPMKAPLPKCHYQSQNAECLHNKCPFNGSANSVKRYKL